MASIEKITLTRTDSQDEDFISLIAELDAGLHEIYGAQMDFYGQFNKVDHIKHVIVAYINNLAVGCGAIKRFDTHAAEVKRMFVKHQYRGKGIAGTILAGLENWAEELGYTATVLETGKELPAAVNLYHKKGYTVIENYGQYAGVENSICFNKML